MKSIFKFLLFLCISFSSLSIFAQDSLNLHQSARIEIGLGTGMAGEGGGLSGRIAISYLHSNWGGIIRLSAHDGGEGEGSGWFGPPVEKFYDKGILVSYIPIQTKYWQIITSAGIGSCYGERLSENKYYLEEFESPMGIAWEIGLASAGSTLGFSLNIAGNINSESNLIAFILSATLGYQE